MTLGTVLLGLFLLYAASFFTGWRLAKTGRLSLSWLIRTRRALADPITALLQRWQDRVKLECIREKRWLSLWLVIFFNNLVLVAAISRALYGLFLVLPLYLTARMGLGHGIFRAHSLRPTGKLTWIAIIEFGAYLLATALGMNAGLQLLVNGLVGFNVALHQCAVGFIVVSPMLLLAALLEVSALESKAADIRLPPDLDSETFRAQALRALQKLPPVSD